MRTSKALRTLFNLVALTVLLVSCTAPSSDTTGPEATYQQVAAAITSSDFSSLRSHLSLQEGLTFENLEQNWNRAQDVLRAIYPPPDEITIIDSTQGKNGTRFWIVEFNTVDQGNKHIKSYMFSPDSSNKTGWKLSATAHFGSYTYPDEFGIRDGVVKDIRRMIQSD